MKALISLLPVCLALTAAAQPLPDQVPVPGDNPTTAAKVELGKQLFFDPRLSSTGTVSCNSCHNVMANGTDNRAVSQGVDGKTGTRSAPTVWNSALKPAQFWDGRAATLEEQAKGPLLNPVEMGMAGPEAVEAVVQNIPGYVKAFESVFGPYSVTFDNIARAIAAYERTLVTPDSPYDRHLAGEATALGAQASRGLSLFQSVGCMACHAGPSLAGPTPVGVPFRQKFPAFGDAEFVARYGLTADQGYFETTGREEDRLMFQVPTLRNVALTAPYMSQGTVPTLREAVQVMATTQLNRTLEPAELADLVIFMEALTGEFPAQTLPRLPESVGESVIINPGRSGPL